MASYCGPIGLKEWTEPEVESWQQPEELAASPEFRRIMAALETLARTSIGGAELALEERFREQAEKWERETEHLSSPAQMMMHPSYQAIMGMALQNQYSLVRLMLRDLKDNRRMWFWALSYLTGENPIKPSEAGNLDKMIRAWVRWGEYRGMF